MRDRPPAFQFYPRQFAGDDRVMGMDLEAIGAHILLMCAAACSPERCRIHADEYAIRMRLRNPSDDDWQRIKKQLLSGAWKVSEDGLWWIQNGLQRTLEKQKEFSSATELMRDGVRGMPNRCRMHATMMPQRYRTDALHLLLHLQIKTLHPNLAGRTQARLAETSPHCCRHPKDRGSPKCFADIFSGTIRAPR
jgi:hypothetical protein